MDILVLSNMMDGNVLSLRKVLDKVGYFYMFIMSYFIKFVSSYYGFFRDVVNFVLSFGDCKSY